jgi:two-component system, sensor histidine kinase and response regulator
MNLGADDFLIKPFMSHELLAAINKRFEKKKSIESRANQRLDKFRKDIARVLPHEFRTPLSTILGVSNILMDECDDMDKEELREMISFVNISAKRLNRLIENYLLYVSLDHNDGSQESKISTTMSAFLLNENFLQTISKYDRTDDLVMETSDNHVESVMLRIDESYLGKIIEELADNACKFSEKSSPIRITSSLDSDGYHFTISNTGIGIMPEQINTIGAFVQFDRESREQQGAGLGLALVKRLTEMCNGIFTIKSIPNVLTTVTITIPLATSNEHHIF